MRKLKFSRILSLVLATVMVFQTPIMQVEAKSNDTLTVNLSKSKTISFAKTTETGLDGDKFVYWTPTLNTATKDGDTTTFNTKAIGDGNYVITDKKIVKQIKKANKNIGKKYKKAKLKFTLDEVTKDDDIYDNMVNSKVFTNFMMEFMGIMLSLGFKAEEDKTIQTKYEAIMSEYDDINAEDLTEEELKDYIIEIYNKLIDLMLDVYGNEIPEEEKSQVKKYSSFEEYETQAKETVIEEMKDNPIYQITNVKIAY